MRKLSWIIIAFNAISVILDIISSEALWSTGLYIEGNLLYYIMGKIGFYAFMWLIMLLFSVTIYFFDRRKGIHFKIGTVALGGYGLMHLIPAINQLIIYAQLIIGR